VTSDLYRHFFGLLFPNWCRRLGFFFILSGSLVSFLIYVFDRKPAFLNINVFAVFSYYFEKKYFSVIKNDAGEEIIIILVLVGLLLVSFSKLKDESEQTVLIRIKAILLSVYINTFFLVLAAAFIYGMGFIAVTVINCFTLLLINVIVFQVILLKQKKQSR
jgi:hypothetical protein